MQVLRAILFYVVYLIMGLVVPWITLPMALRRDWAESWWRWWCRTLLRASDLILNLRYDVQGAENIPQRGPFILASLHQSTWDIFFLGALCPRAAFVHKRELAWIPPMFFYQRALGFLGVDRRAGLKSLRRLLQAARATVAAGRPIGIFPEGQRHSYTHMGTFRAGIYSLYEMLDVPVVPVVHVAGYFWPRRAFLKKPGVIPVRILPPIPPGLGKQAFQVQLLEAMQKEHESALDFLRKD